MESSSDSEEFYECDDEVEDVKQEIAKKIKENIEPKKEIPAVKTDSKPDNNYIKPETNTEIIKEATETYNVQDFVKTSNNNPDEEKEKVTEKVDNETETIKNNNLSDNTLKNESVKPLLKKDEVKEEKEEVESVTIIENDNLDRNKSEKALEEMNEDNLWEDNNWGDMDQEDNKSKQIVPEIKKSETQPEENLWEDEDDWGKLEPEPKPQPKAEIDQTEEDLWGDGDGWGVDAPQDTKSSNIQQKLSEESDLWAEGDNWGITETTKPPTPTPTTKSEAISTLDALSNQSESTWGSWSNWGISSVLSTAANITTSVSQGISTVLESGIPGIPDPTELARQHKTEEEARRQAGDFKDNPGPSEEHFVPFGLGNFSKITKLVETTGTKVINTGLGTLETIGKKTYEVLQENDPQLKKKRALLKYLEAEKPVLSSILREAKERAETDNKDRERKHFAKKANYETMFDDYTGLVHLEALEMLSKQCDYKLESILSQTKDVTEVQETMEQIKDLCELNTDDNDDDDEDFDELKEKMTTAIGEINIGISCEKVLETYGEIAEWIETTNSNNPDEIHSNAIENLAKITALAVEQYHKAAELLLVKEHRSTADEADSLVQLTTSISALIGLLSTNYTEKLKQLTSQATNDEIKTLISNIYLEAANSSRYVEDAFGLLIPVIQVGAV